MNDTPNAIKSRELDDASIPNAIERLALESDIIARGNACPSCGAEWSEDRILDHVDTCRHVALTDLVRLIHEMRHFERELEDTALVEDDLLAIASAIHQKFGEWRSVLNHIEYVR